jgi:hypothetical protein
MLVSFILKIPGVAGFPFFQDCRSQSLYNSLSRLA